MKILYLLMLLLFSGVAYSEEYVKTGRYIETDISIDKNYLDPLEVIIDFTFPENISLVGEALDLLLSQSGYRIQLSENDVAYVLFEMPLPHVHKKLVNIKLRNAVSVLAGKGFEPSFDEAARLLRFTSKSESINSLQVSSYKEKWLKHQNEKSQNILPLSLFVDSRIDSNADYLVKKGDSVSKIIMGHGKVYSEKMKNLFVSMNPHAFVDSNADYLKSGVYVRMPTND